MLIATWNVNSIRTRIEQVNEWLDEFKPDLLCLQETKVEDKSFPLEGFVSKGYKIYFYGQKSYNGVAFISKSELYDVKYGFKDELGNNNHYKDLEEQKRVISCILNGVRVINVYVPNGSSINSDKYRYKIKWLNYLKSYLKKPFSKNEPICLLGDFNIAPEDKDIHSPDRLSGGIMASELERKALEQITQNQLHDVFRIFEQETNHWSWWDYRSSAWQRDKGWRIDHIYLSEELIRNSKNCKIHKRVRGLEKPSDHAPVMVEINWPPIETDDEEDFFFNEL